MKYCAKCGTQLIDEAIVCTNCGCMTGKTTQKTEDKQIPTIQETSDHHTKAIDVFNFVFSLTTMLSCFFVLLALITAEIYTSHSSWSDYYYSYYYTEGVSCFFACFSAFS